MPHEPSILVAVFHSPVDKGNVTVVEVPFGGQSIPELREKLKLSPDTICVVDKEIDGPIRIGSKVVFAPAAAWAVVWQLITAIAWGALVSLAVYYIMQGLFGNDPPDKKEQPNAQSFGWQSFTRRQEGIPKPYSFGTNMHYGNVVQKFTDVDSSGDEVLYLILDYGQGPIQGRGSNIVYLDDQPIGNFAGVSVQDRYGTLDQTCMDGFEKHKQEYKTDDAEITYADGALIWTTPNKNFNDIEYTLEFARGLWYYSDMGDQMTHGVGVKVEISERGLSTWTTLLNTTITGNQMSPVFKAYKVNTQVPGTVERNKQYDLRFTKTSTDRGIARFGDTFGLRSVREVIDVAFRRPGRALLGITALATERLSGRFDIKWVSDDKLCNVFDGTSWSIEFTRNRAWVWLAQITQPVISGNGGADPWAIELYEGLDPSRVDLAFIYEWAEWCSQQVDDGNGGTEDRMTCDIICDYETTVWRLSYEIAQVGRMHPYWQGQTLTGWVDKATTEPIDLITFDNIMTRSWKSGNAGYGEMAGNAEIFYKDALHGYERKSYPVPNEDAGLYTRTKQVEGVGVTGQGLAIRVANHIMQRNKLLKNINSVRMFKDALRYRLGRVLRLQATVPNWGQCFRVIEATSNNTLLLDRHVNVSDGELLFVKSYDSENKTVSMNSYTVASSVGDTVTIVETWLVTPDKEDSCAIGMAGAIKLRRIVKMKATSDNYFDLELETYDTDLFDSDDLPLYIDNPDYVWPAPASQLVKPLTTQQVRAIIHQMLPNRPDIEIPWTSNLDWSGNAADTISWSKRDATKPILFKFRGVAYEITADSTTDEFVYWDPNFTTQFRSTNDAATALATGMWLMCINKAGFAFPANGVQLMHAAILLAGTIRASQYAELRQTFVYNGDDSLDASEPLTVPFKLVSEMTAIVTIKLSFRIMPYRAYHTATAAGGSSTPTSANGGSGTWDTTGPANWGLGGDTEGPSTANTSTVDPGDTDYEDLGTHYHQMPTHDHDLSGSTEDEDGADNYTGYDSGGGSHRHSISYTNHDHNLSYSANVSSEDPGNTYTYDFVNHRHTMPTHYHSMQSHTHGLSTAASHTHELSLPNHTHTVTIGTHVHGITYGIFEETNSPTVHYHIDNGAGFGSPSANYTTDQIDLNVAGSLSGTGWKAIRFDSNLRCRIAAIVECKIDITA